MESVGSYAFNYITIDSVYVHSIPFTLSTNSVFGNTYKTLIVPKGTRDIFGTRDGWKSFNNIIEGDFEPSFNVDDYPAGDWSLPHDGYQITQDNLTYKLYKSGVASIYSQSYPANEYTVLDVKVPESIYAMGHTFPVTGVEYFKTNNNVIVNLQLPNTITYVYNVKGGVKTLTLPASVKTVSGLQESNGLQAFAVAEGNEYFSVDEKGVLYNKDKTTLLYAPYGKRSSLTSFVVPSTVESISDNSFEGFDNLTGVTLPNGLKSIGNDAFRDCSKLTTCKLPSTVESIGSYAFYGCTLSNLVLPSGLKNIYQYAFAYGIKDSKLRSLTLPEVFEYAGSYAFNYVTIDSVYTRVMEPLPIGTSSVFGDPSNQVLIVPTGTSELYKNTEGWNKIPHIIESDEMLPSSVRCMQPKFVRQENILTITAEPSDAQIYYTMDGKDPTASSSLYDKPLELNGNCIVKAIAMKEGLQNSPIATFNADWFVVADVEFRWVNLQVELTTKTEGAVIHYTIDGSDPTDKSPAYQGAPLSFAENCTIKAIAMKKNWNSSNITSFDVDLSTITCSTPTFRRSGKSLVIETATVGGEIFYTLDDTEPTANSLKYDPNTPIVPTENCIVRAMVMKVGYRNSDIGVYKVDWFTVEDVTIEMVGQKLTMKTETEGTTIRYTLDGTSPTETSTLYEGPVELTENCTVKAIAFKEGYEHSQIATFVVDVFTVADVEIKIVNLQIEMSTATEGATIRYTLNGSDPTEQSPVYQGMPLSITENCTIKAFGMKPNWNNSRITTFDLDFSTVTCGNPTFRMSGKQLVIETSTIGATIYYTLDETEPTKQSEKYEGPVTMTKNCIVKAVVMKDGYRSSAVETYEVSVFKVSAPTITLNGGTLIMTTEPSDAVICYTLNGDDPTESSTRYTAPIELQGNCTVKAIAIKDGYQTSPMTTYVVDAFTVADVEIKLVNLQIEMSTATEGATIRYTLNGSDPTEQSPVYQGMPLSITENCTIKAFGMKPNWNNSRITTFDLDFSTVTCGNPTFRMSGKQLIIETSTVGGVIYYTLDETEPTKQSSKYEGPITMTRNCIVKAVVMKDGYRSSAVETYEVTTFQVDEPIFAVNGTKLTIQCATEGAIIYYSIGENSVPQTKYEAPITLLDNQPIRAFAKKDGYTDSPVVEYSHSLMSCQPATLKEYDGRYFTLDDMPEGVMVYYTVDGTIPTKESTVYDGRTAVSGRCTLKTLAAKEWMNDSEVKSYELDYYFDGENADLSSEGQLLKAMAWANKEEITTLNVAGPLNASDLNAIKNSLITLQHLNLEKATIAGKALPDEAFAGMPLITFSSPSNINSIGSSIFANCQQLAAIIWNSDEKMPNNSFGDTMNPNILIYAWNKMLAPSGVRNIVVNGTAYEIQLSDAETNNNFYCPRAFKANKISYVHNYSMETGYGTKAAGWETIVLPFTVQKIVHESKGELSPYLKFEQEGYPDSGRPFWLRELTVDGFVDAAVIEANTPYIISMPNNPEYANRYNVAGNVTFSAEQADVLVSTDLKKGQKDRVSFVPTFTRQTANSKIWAINRNEAIDNYAPGSVFVPGLRDVKPFEAYTTNDAASASRLLAISELSDSTTGIYDVLYHGYRLSDLNAEVKVYNMSGNLVISGKRSEVMKRLSKGVYIVNGKKIVVE